MQQLREEDLCPTAEALTPGSSFCQVLPDGTHSSDPGADGSAAAFWGASSGLALAVFMAEMVAQVRKISENAAYDTRNTCKVCCGATPWSHSCLTYTLSIARPG